MVSCNLTYGPQANKNKTRLVTDFLPKHRFLSDLDGLVMYHLKENSCCHICSLQFFSWLHRQLTRLFWSTFWLLGYFLPFSLLCLVMDPFLPSALTDKCKGSSFHLSRCLLFPVIYYFALFGFLPFAMWDNCRGSWFCNFQKRRWYFASPFSCYKK